MASNFCVFNLAEVCRTTIELIKNPEHDILSTLPAPDFTTGGDLIYDEGVFYKAPNLDEQTVRDIAVSTMPGADVDREYVVKLVMANYAKLLK